MADQQNVAPDEQDPGANTQMFRAFVNEGSAAPEPKHTGRVVAGLAVAVVLVAVIVYFLAV